MTPDDLARIHAAAFTTERSWAAQEFHALQSQPHTHLTSCPDGFALWRALAEEAELLTIAVDPAHQRTGIGRALMERWMADAALLATSAFLEVARDNGAACALYARFGFETVSVRRNYYKRRDGTADALVMRVELRA